MVGTETWWVSTAAKVLERSPAFALAAALMTGVVLFGPDGFIEALGLLQARAVHRRAIGLSFLISACCGIALLVRPLGDLLVNEVLMMLSIHAARKRLRKLTEDEKFILKGYIDGRTRTQYLEVNDGVVMGLVHAEVLYRSTTLSLGATRFAFNMKDWAWDYLNQYPGLVR